MSATPDEFRAALSRLAGGVVIVTTRGAGGEPRGMTATAVCSVSLEPPLVMACLNQAAATHGAVARSGVFALNVLPAAAEPLARRFSASIPDKFAELSMTRSHTGAPILEGALAYCECAVVRSVPAGTHT
ncbi:MAG: flavin reductase family protein, partial [Gemmatimonadota bacterium]